jgi:hypothetical protein
MAANLKSARGKGWPIETRKIALVRASNQPKNDRPTGKNK